MNKKITEEYGQLSEEGKKLVSRIRGSEAAELRDGEIDESWTQVKARSKSGMTEVKARSESSRAEEKAKRKSGRRRGWRAAIGSAAAVALILGVGGYFLHKVNAKPDLLRDAVAESEMTEASKSGNIRFVTPNFELEIPDGGQFVFTPDGKLLINGKTAMTFTGKLSDQINRIEVPRGRKAAVILSDSTSVIINSNTSITFPEQFSKDGRELAVDGEVFMDVAKDASRPFQVRTRDFSIKVLGTEFDIRAYRNEESSSVILVRGSVQVTADNRVTVLKPNDSFKYEKHKTSVAQVDPFDQICWKDSMMPLGITPVSNVFDKLADTFGVEIKYDESVGSIPIGGFLEVKDSVEDDIKAICLSLDLNYSIEGNTITITRK